MSRCAHYAEVHLILEPGEPGSGISIDTICSEDVLDKNWQRLILTHVLEREHRGVLTGSVLTDVKITLASGRAHLEAYRGRRLPPGGVSCDPPGTDAGRECTA